MDTGLVDCGEADRVANREPDQDSEQDRADRTPFELKQTCAYRLGNRASDDCQRQSNGEPGKQRAEQRKPLIAAGLPGVMVAHVVYWQVDPSPASFSSRWLGEELRSRLDFRGPIFSDDLDMGAAAAAGDMVTRATAALDAGCDMILACNNRPGVVEIVDALGARSEPASQIRLVRMHGKPMPGRDELTASGRWREAVEILRDYLDKPELHLDA